jgi:hypothetical protein
LSGRRGHGSGANEVTARLVYRFCDFCGVHRETPWFDCDEVHQPNVPIPRVTKLMAGKLPLGLVSNNDRDVASVLLSCTSRYRKRHSNRVAHRQTAAFYA